MLAAVVSIVALAALVAVATIIVRRTLRPPPVDATVPPALVGTAAEAVTPVLPATAPAARRSRKPHIVLIHGLFGFDTLGVGPAKVAYFRGVARRLARRGVDVSIVRLPPLAGVPERAQSLIAQLDKIDSDRLTLVAHSLGGLDARWAVARDPALAARVATLITIGTPHRGTPIADLFATGAPDKLRAVLARLGLGTDALDWLTTKRLDDFNRDIADVAGVTYASVVAATEERGRVHALLRVPHTLLRRYGPSDGLVPAWSQAWGDVVARVEVDHWAQIGWAKGPDGHDAAVLIERALDGIAALPAARSQRLLTAPVGRIDTAPPA